jgi:hypothetical protein
MVLSRTKKRLLGAKKRRSKGEEIRRNQKKHPPPYPEIPLFEGSTRV